MWDSVEIMTDDGLTVKASAPIIVSASRSTDIPAFFPYWLINRLRKGYAKWVNPFNQVPLYISFSKTRVIVFWTKNPKPLLPYLAEIDKMSINYYFQFTINDYEREGLEPNVPPLEERVETFNELSRRVGKERVIWRFDPLILIPPLTVDDLLLKIERLGERLVEHTDKLVVSFVDIKEYRKVQQNLIKELPDVFRKDTVLSAEFRQEDKERFASGLQSLVQTWRKSNPGFTVATCAEDLDLAKYGIAHNKCIDDDLMIQLFNKDEILMDFLGYEPRDSLFKGTGLMGPTKTTLKDKGQRKACGCIVSRDIGAYNTCRHLCVYCYANASKRTVEKKKARHDDSSDEL